MTSSALHQARALAAAGRDEAAKQAYLAILRLDPDQVPALIEFGVLAETGGYRSAARSAYQRAVVIDPDHALARTGLANTLRASGNLTAARDHYRAALRSDPDCAAAHQGLAGVLFALGDPAAEAHWRAGYAGRTAIARRYRGAGPGTNLLLLFSAKGGNIDIQPWIDDRRYAVTALCADYHDAEAPLPAHDLIVNAIGDADLCADALENAERIIARSLAPVINPPALIGPTTRAGNAQRLAAIPGVVTPRTASVPRHAIASLRDWRFPLLLRSPGFHTGQHCLRVDTADALAEAAAALPGEALLAIAYHDCRGPDGLARKYRAMFIDGAVYPLHMAASDDWKVHYFTAAMAENKALRAEEARFLNRMPEILGARATAALSGIAETLGLDYAGTDFALCPDGSILVFEANATMVAPPPGPDPIWDYRRDAVTAVLNAARAMVSRRAMRMAAWHPIAEMRGSGSGHDSLRSDTGNNSAVSPTFDGRY
jgi:tetratricopeptide (TPR) repeat protein